MQPKVRIIYIVTPLIIFDLSYRIYSEQYQYRFFDVEADAVIKTKYG